MKRFFPVWMAVGAVLSLQAATLDLYRDGAVYTFEPSGTFLGFLPKRAKAECGDRSLSIVPSAECPKESRLCREKATIERWGLESAYAFQRMHYIETLMKRAEVKTTDPKAVMAMAEEAARNYSAMQKRKERADKEVKWRRENFLKQAPMLEAQHLAKACDKPLKLTIPGNYISFGIEYEADLSDEKRIAVTRNIVLRNRSGIDIDAQTATLRYEPMHRRLSPIRFSPWVIRDRQTPKMRVAKSMTMSAPAPVYEMAEDMEYGRVESDRARNYRIDGLKLPSSGERVTIAAGRWKLPAEREEAVYPYRDSRVYRVIRFKPEAPVEANRWRIRKDGLLVASEVYGDYEKGRYTLFVSVDEDLVVRKEPMILKEKESFFGGTVHKKDGYVIHLLNQSNETKRLKVIERIPLAVRSDVKVKLLSVECDKSLKKRLLEKGRLEMEVTLPPKSHADLRVLFEISYDKEKPILY